MFPPPSRIIKMRNFTCPVRRSVQFILYCEETPEGRSERKTVLLFHSEYPVLCRPSVERHRRRLEGDLRGSPGPTARFQVDIISNQSLRITVASKGSQLWRVRCCDMPTQSTRLVSYHVRAGTPLIGDL